MAAQVPIGEAARLCGVATSTLRYYEERGLVAPTGRSGGVRRYDREKLRRIVFVRRAQSLGMSLDTIAALLSTGGTPWRDLVAGQLDELRRRRAELDAAIDYLTQARDCPSPHPLSDCPQLRAQLDTALAARPSP